MIRLIHSRQRVDGQERKDAIVKQFIVWAEYQGNETNLLGSGNVADRDTAIEVAQDFLWGTELSRPEVLSGLTVSLVPLKYGNIDWDNAESIEI